MAETSEGKTTAPAKQCVVACPPDAPRCECRERLLTWEPSTGLLARLSEIERATITWPDDPRIKGLILR